MDQMRLMAALVLSFLVFFLWNTFFGHEPPPKPASAPESVAEKRIEAPPVPVVPGTDAPAPATPTVESAPARSAREITIRTPLYTVGLSEQGAVINRFVLHNYRVRVERDAPNLNLFPDDGSVGSLYVGAAGIPGLEDALYQFQGQATPSRSTKARAKWSSPTARRTARSAPSTVWPTCAGSGRPSSRNCVPW